MQKAEAQQQNVRNQSAFGRGGGTAAVLPQGERTAQLEATIESSPQAERLGGLASMIAASPAMAVQRNRIGQIHNSPAMVAQGKAAAVLNNISFTAQRQDAEGIPQVEERPLGSEREPAHDADVPGGLQGTASVERTEGSEQAGNVEAKEKHAALESNVPGGGAGEVSPDGSDQNGKSNGDAEEGNEVPVAEGAGETHGVAVAAPDTKAGSIVVEQPEGAAGQANAAGGGNKGSADAAIDFLNSPASVMARGIDQLGGRLASGFHEDVGKLAATTPSVTAGISKAGIEPPRQIPVPKKAAAPAPGKWTPPAVAIRSDAPKFSPAGNANPQMAETEAASRGAQVAAGGNRLNAEIVGASGEELVQGRQLNATEHVQLAASKASVQTNTVPEMEEYMNIDMPEGFRQQVDAASAGMFRQSLAGPRAQIENAKARRDQDQTGAILDANRQADALGKKANEEQAQTIRLSRDRIGTEKEKSLAESKSVLAEYDGKVGKAKQGKIDEINAQIASHEKQANTALVEADTKVAAEQQKVDRQKAEEERKGAEAKKKKRKWWQKIGDFFSNIAKSVAKAVSTIVNALASVVKSIVTAARTLANSIINTCTALVKKLLDTFASVVKGFLDVALAAFPAIRKRLNAAIDKFVSAAAAAIDKIADTLKAAVNKLCDTLTQIVEFAQNFMVSAIQGAMMMFKAIITGNFADLPRIAFMTACNSLGLPGEELWSIVQKAAGQAMEIIKKPAKFLGNLIKAGMQGFGQFVGNIKQHIMSGLMGWLMGQVGQSGITLPEKFDGPGIFLLIRQVLGVTYEYVRERAVSIIGEKNAARVEMVLDYLKRLFTEPAALFAELKEKATEMKDSFIDQIQDWAITTVIQKAVIKVTSMLIPGSGFVQAIYGMWQTLQFFLENIKKIAAVVNSLLDSMAQISKGAIGAAANYVEKTMVDTLPLVFAWLAKLIGIDGIGQKVKGIIDKLRTPVNSAVDFVIKGAMKLGSAAVDKVKGGASAVKNKLTSWWRGRKEFTTRDGEAHAVYVEGEGTNARIVVNPVPKQDVSSFLDKAAAKLPEDAKQKKAVQGDIAKARTALTALKGDMAEIEDAEQKAAKDGGETVAATDKERQEAQRELEGLADTLQRIMEATGVALPGEGEIGKMSSEQRKAGAMNRFISLMKARTSMDKQELDGILVNLKSQFKLSDAKLEGEPQNAKIGFYASPATYLPVMLVMPPIDGQKAGAVAAGRPSVTAGDFIRAINYDGPFPTPGHEVATEFDARFMGQNTVYSSASVASPKKKSKVQSVVGGINPASLNLHTQTNANAYHRAGAVEAKSSVVRGTGRSGAGETLFGHFGADEEKILTGKHNTNYNGGHLIGDQIMDSHQAFNLYEDWNLAPQQRSFNSPVYTSTIENPVTAAIKGGATVEYTVTVQYPATTYPIQPSVLVKNLYSADAGYRKEVEGAIALNPGLDAPFDLTRRTPGFWQATANVVAGPNIASGNIGIRQNVAFENNPANVQTGVVYSPMNQEQVRYSLEIDQGGGWQAQAGPVPTRYQYAGAQSIRVTARQQTF